MAFVNNFAEVAGPLDLEPEIAVVLARRRRNRLKGPYRPRSEAEIQPLLQSFMEKQEGHARDKVVNVARLGGGASKEQFRYDLVAPDGTSQRYVLRMDPLESIVETSRLREFDALRAFEGLLPAPRAMWLDADGAHFGAPTIVTSFVNGVTKPKGAPGGNVSGLGTNVGPEWRDVLAKDYIRHWATIHAYDWRSNKLPSFVVPNKDPQQAARLHLNWWTQVWIDDVVEPNPTLAAIEGWLRDDIPPCTEFVFCHSDYRTGNYLIDEDTRKISAVLDWELAHLGDFHDDLGSAVCKTQGHRDEKGVFLCSGLLPRRQFLDRYMDATGRTVDIKTLHYYEVLNNFKAIVVMMATSHRIATEKHNHQNALQTWIIPAAHVVLSETCRLIDKGPDL